MLDKFEDWGVFILLLGKPYWVDLVQDLSGFICKPPTCLSSTLTDLWLFLPVKKSGLDEKYGFWLPVLNEEYLILVTPAPKTEPGPPLYV